VAGGLCAAVATPIGGWLSDRYGRRPVMILAAALLLGATLPAFRLMLAAPSAANLMLAAGGLGALSSLAFTPALAALTEALPAPIRSGALGLVYAVAIAVFGGTTQWMAAWLTRESGSALAPAWYMTGAVALCLAGMLLTPETAPLRRRPRRADQAL
jgi:MFS family permease